MAEAVGVVLSVAQTLLATLDNQKLKQIWSSIVGSESQLEKLRDTVTTIKAVLLDAAYRHQQLNHQEQALVERLKDAVYDADDLFDEYATVALQLNSLPGGKLSKKVRQFFSDKNQLLLGQKMSSEIKKLREKLDNIAKDSADFGFSLVHKPVIKRPETSSFVFESNVIGREVEKKSMIDLMLSDSADVSFVTIVGMGGLGKTTLAQLVYNDDMIQKAFDLRLWVCVSEDFGMKQILSKMLQLATKVDHGDLLLDVLQEKVKQRIQGERYLLVLDDVWEESHLKWQELKEFLVSGARGSRILITTRSKQVGMTVDKDMMHELEGLSEEDSWNLFKNIALEQGNTDLEEIGRNIVKKCVNVPLSIKVTASLLHGQDRTQWLMFGKLNLPEMTRRDEDSIMPTLMFSYHHLSPELKSCFSFCSLFPKDYVFSKWQLISLWMAQGFVAPLEGQSMEDMGEIYFSTLMNRCFFQDIETDEHGDVKTCKMHDLVHDLAKEVAGLEMFFKENTNPIERKIIRHLSTFYYACFDNYGSCVYKLRTYLWLGRFWDKRIDDVDKILSYGRCSRVLDLRKLSITIPHTLGKFSHLRYLDLSHNIELDKLPKSITKLHNLQILILEGCDNLKELPEDTSKLVNLRCLDIDGCDKLSHMPRGMDKLTCLHRLTRYVVGGDDCKHVKKGELADLKHLVNLRGELCIKVGRCFSNKMPNVPKGSSSLMSAQLKALKIQLVSDESGAHETLLEGLPKNNDLRIFEMKGYQGRILPSWASPMSTSLPQLVRITLRECGGLKHLSSLGQLVHLKILIIYRLPNVEYMDDDLPSPLTPFLPCLEELELVHMPKLKGWWRDLRWKESEEGVGCLVDGNGFHQLENLPLFPRLRELSIDDCKSMTYIPPCPYVKKLSLFRVNEEVTFCMKGGILPVAGAINTSSASSLSTTLSSDLQLVCSTRESENCILYLEELEINNLMVLKAIYREFVGGVGSINLYLSGDREKIWSVPEEFQIYVSSLRILCIRFWKSMEGGGLEHLTNLQSLVISYCDELDLEEEDDKGRIPWKSLHSLTSLTIWQLPKLVKLPKGLRYLTSLQSLYITYCSNLEALGECIGFLTSLTTLLITEASDELKERCRKPDGLDWPNICHIPDLRILK